MAIFIIKYNIYFNKIHLTQKGQIEIEDCLSFSDIEDRATIIFNN